MRKRNREFSIFSLSAVFTGPSGATAHRNYFRELARRGGGGFFEGSGEELGTELLSGILEMVLER